MLIRRNVPRIVNVVGGRVPLGAQVLAGDVLRHAQLVNDETHAVLLGEGLHDPRRRRRDELLRRERRVLARDRPGRRERAEVALLELELERDERIVGADTHLDERQAPGPRGADPIPDPFDFEGRRTHAAVVLEGYHQRVLQGQQWLARHGGLARRRAGAAWDTRAGTAATMTRSP
jgi:hypothetical protein